MGDMYDLERAQLIVNILKDDMIIRADLCKINDIAKEQIAKGEEILQKIKSYKKPFEEMAQKICSYLDQKQSVHRELCQEPLNNDSWKYSVSQALTKQTPRKKRKAFEAKQHG